MCEFLINAHRITFYSSTEYPIYLDKEHKKVIEGVEFDKNNSFVSRIFMNHEDFKTLIVNYKRYEERKK